MKTWGYERKTRPDRELCGRPGEGASGAVYQARKQDLSGGYPATRIRSNDSGPDSPGAEKPSVSGSRPPEHVPPEKNRGWLILLIAAALILTDLRMTAVTGTAADVWTESAKMTVGTKRTTPSPETPDPSAKLTPAPVPTMTPTPTPAPTPTPTPVPSMTPYRLCQSRPPLQPVGGLRAEKTEQTSVTLSWSGVTYAGFYRVMVKEQNASSAWTEAARTTDTTARVTQLRAGTAYQFKVVAMCGDFSSESRVVAERTAGEEEAPAPVEIGSYIRFGHYPQSAGGGDYAEIEWLVLDIDEAGHKALLISRYGLDCKPYNRRKTRVTWETCSLRAWLNEAFLEKAFSAEEQKAIVPTRVDNGAGQGYGEFDQTGGNDTEDRIFLLSYDEARRYFSRPGAGQCRATEFAASQGAHRDRGSGNCCWWQRSPGASQSEACIENSDDGTGCCDVAYCNGAVRPALWVELKPGVF